MAPLHGSVNQAPDDAALAVRRFATQEGDALSEAHSAPGIVVRKQGQFSRSLHTHWTSSVTPRASSITELLCMDISGICTDDCRETFTLT
jgi:hypothetical protein